MEGIICDGLMFNLFFCPSCSIRSNNWFVNYRLAEKKEQFIDMKKSRTKPQNNTTLNKVPPQNIEAEASLLSAILIDNRILDDVADVLAASDFYRTAHQIIYGAMLELAEKNEPVDLVTLVSILKDREKLESVGGAIYLAKLIDEVPLAVNAGHYAKIIHDKIPFEGKAELIVAKQRNGPTDSFPLAFLKSYSRFKNLAFDDK